MSAVEQLVPPSFCVACDAPEGGCSCGGARYHDSWFLLQTAPGSGKIKPEYRAWFEENPFSHDQPPEPKPRPLSTLIAELEAWCDLTPRIEAKVKEAYETAALKLTRVAASVVEGAKNGTLKSPTSYLMHRLKEFDPE